MKKKRKTSKTMINACGAAIAVSLLATSVQYYAVDADASSAAAPTGSQAPQTIIVNGKVVTVTPTPLATSKGVVATVAPSTPAPTVSPSTTTPAVVPSTPAPTAAPSIPAPETSPSTSTPEVSQSTPEATPIPTEIPQSTPETTDAPETTQVPQSTPEITETPQETADATETPEITETPALTETPKTTDVPETTETPETTDTSSVVDEPKEGQAISQSTATADDTNSSANFQPSVVPSMDKDTQSDETEMIEEVNDLDTANASVKSASSSSYIESNTYKIAGSNPLVGGVISDNGYGNGSSASSTGNSSSAGSTSSTENTTVTTTPSPVANSSSQSTSTSEDNPSIGDSYVGSSEDNSYTGSSTTGNGISSATTKRYGVLTGDNTNVFPYLATGVTAAFIAIMTMLTMGRKKKNIIRNTEEISDEDE